MVDHVAGSSCVKKCPTLNHNTSNIQYEDITNARSWISDDGRLQEVELSNCELSGLEYTW